MKYSWMILAVLCMACAPRTAPTTATVEPEPPKHIAVPGGVVEGRVAKVVGGDVVLPEAPRVASHSSGTLYVGYPFLLLIYEKGLVKNNLPLPGTPKFIRVSPSLVVGLDNALMVGNQSLNLKASDALLNREGLYWVDGKALYLGRNKIADGAYTALTGNDQLIYAFAKNVALRLPDNTQITLPIAVKRAVLMGDLYILGETGIYHLSPDGLQISFKAGKFEGLEAENGRLYTLENGKLRVLSASLEVVSGSSAISHQPSATSVEGRRPKACPFMAFRAGSEACRRVERQGDNLTLSGVMNHAPTDFVLPVTRHPSPVTRSSATRHPSPITRFTEAA